jgi:hypothetical protein
LINEITEETYDDFLKQYSESCRPHVERWVAGAAVAAARFNEGKYLEAEILIERHVKPGSAQNPSGSGAILFSEDCNDDDVILTIQQSIALEPMLSSAQCMVRVAEADRDWLYAQETFNSDDPQSLVQTVQHIDDAIYTIEDIVSSGSCDFLELGVKQQILDTQSEWKRMRTQIYSFIKEPND